MVCPRMSDSQGRRSRSPKSTS